VRPKSCRDGLAAEPLYASGGAFRPNRRKDGCLGQTLESGGFNPREPGPIAMTGVDALVKDTPLRRFGTLEEVAAMATFMASDESPYITGSEMNIDGGLLAGNR
jgi:NAD(P)-dependent dehydrogenase (short-subunit alcohol dehydrogenase family)